MKKYLLLFITFLLLITPVKAESKYLYDVLKEEAEKEGGLAKEYTGEHQDSITKEATHKIYHWYAETDGDGSQIRNKMNLVFGGICWKIIRTTDTGGVRLLYNGLASNDNKCTGNDDGTIEYSFTLMSTNSYNNNNYYYSDSYTYDSSTNNFVLSDNVTQIMFDRTNIDQIRGKYSCFSNNTSCNRLYYVIDEQNNYFNTITFYKNQNNSSIIGIANYNYGIQTPNGGGYLRSSRNDTINMISSSDYLNLYSSQLLNDSIYASSEIAWDSSNNNWKLVNPITIKTSNINELVGKYTFGNYMKTSTGKSVMYVYNVRSNDYYYYDVPDISKWRNVNVSNTIYYGDSYIVNNDGTYSLQSPSTMLRSNTRYDYNRIVRKYVCVNGTSDACYELWYIRTANDMGVHRSTTSLQYKYASGYTYNNGIFKLNDDRIDYWNTNLELESIKTHRYTCLSEEDECKDIYYAYYASSSSINYIKLEKDELPEDILNQYFTDNDTDSSVKKVVDFWYEKNLITFNDYIEDNIYCNNRATNSIAGWSLNGDNTKKIEINDNFGENQLKCFNQTDKLSVNNSKAKLKYPVALLSRQELQLINNSVPLAMNYSIWTLTPDIIYSDYVCNSLIGYYGDLGHDVCSNVHNSYGVSPAISLKKGATYSSGDGSVDNPYVFESIYSSVNIKTINETDSINVEIDDLTQVEYNEEVKFKVTPIKGYKLNNIRILDVDNNEIEFTATENENEYKFTMPTSDVTIIPSYERVSNSVTVEENSSEQIIIEVNDSSAVLYEDKVKIKVQEKDGYKLTGIKIIDLEGNEIEYTPTENNGEYEFTMPASNVVITPIYEIITVPDTEKNKDYTLYFVLAGLALVLGIVYILLNKKKK